MHHFPFLVALAHINSTLADHPCLPGMSWLWYIHLVITMLQLMWLHWLHSVMSAHADALYLADTKFSFLDPLEQKRATTAGLIRVQLPPNWVESVAD